MNAQSTALKTFSMEDSDFSIPEIDAIVNEALQKFNVPGASISIVLNDKILLSKGYGFRNVDKKLPVTQHTLFPIGSCTKAFTAFLIGQLVDEGQIALDDAVQKYIPEFYLGNEERTSHITIRDLLAHRTGFPRHDAIWFFTNISRSSVIELLKKLEPVCDLGQEFHYNNFMYTVVGIIIERITGQSWEEALFSRLFKPLEMKSSTSSLLGLQEISDFSLPYAEINGILTNIPFHNIFPVNPGGGIVSNALDMTHWIKLQLRKSKCLNDPIIQSQTLEEMHTIQMNFSQLSNDHEITYHAGYGLGWFIGKYRDYHLLSHGGDVDGFSSEVTLLPEKGLGIVILTNSSSDGRYAVSSIRNQILDKILEIEDIDWMNKSEELRIKNKEALYEALKQFHESSQTSFNPSLEAYTGCYVHPAYGIVELKNQNNHLFATYGNLTIPLYFKANNVFSGQFGDLLIYGINPIIDFRFFLDASDTVYKVEIPFEGFRFIKPIPFIRQFPPLLD